MCLVMHFDYTWEFWAELSPVDLDWDTYYCNEGQVDLELEVAASADAGRTLEEDCWASYALLTAGGPDYVDLFDFVG